MRLLFRKRKSRWQRLSEPVVRAARGRGQVAKVATGVVGGLLGLTAASAAASSVRDGER